MKKSFLLSLLMVLALFAPWTVVQAEDLTVNDGTSTNLYVPLYGYYADTSGKSQFVISADAASDMAGGSISGLSFYANSDFSFTGTWEVRLMETSETSVSSAFLDVSGATLVYTGAITISSGVASITFDDAFSYSGDDNLLVEVSLKTSGNCSSSSAPLWYGVSGLSRGGSGYSPASQSFVPKTTFTYTPGTPPACSKPKNLAAAVTPGDGTVATLTWTGGSESEWEVEYGTSSDFAGADPLMVSGGVPTANLSGLTPETQYYAHVKANCGGDGESEWSATISFKTACNAKDVAGWADDFESDIDCWMVGNLESTTSTYIPSRIQNSSYTTYSYSGNYALYLNAYKYSYYSTTTDADGAYAILPAMDFGTKGLAGYTLKFYARQATTSTYSSYYNHLFVGVVEDPFDMTTYTQIADVEVNGTSYNLYEVPLSNPSGTAQYIVLMATVDPASSASTRYGQFYVDDIYMEETPSCQALASISVSNIERRSMTVNLNPKAGLELGSNYDLVYSTVELDAATLETADIKKISGASKVISGLERETKYYIYVRANCGAEGVSEWVSTEATTKGLNGCDEVPVGTGTSTTSSTIVTRSGDKYGYGQTLYKASEIGQSGIISSIAYNLSASSSSYVPNWIIYMGHTSATSLSTWIPLEDLTQVATISTAFTTGWNTIELSTPFDYNGTDNLVIAVANQTGSYSYSSSNSFYYSSESSSFFYRGNDNNSAYGDPSNTSLSGSSSSYKANIKFSFCYTIDACPAITGLDHALVDEGTTKANISWSYSGADYLSGFEIVRSETPLDDPSSVEATPLAADVNFVSYTDLTAGTHYYIYVRAICQAGHDDGNSEWASTDFFTNADCPKVLNLAANLTATNAVHIAWDPAFAGQDLHFQYVLSKTELDAAALEAETPVLVDDATSKDIDELEFEQEYHIYVASKCGGAHSDYEHETFTTLAACQAVKTPLVASRLEHNLVELTWESADFASETQWEVGIVGDESKKQFVTERKALIFGLTPGTNYTAYVKAICSENESSDAVELLFTTAPQPGNCKQVGNGSETTYIFPISNWYKYSYSQQIFDASELQTGTINAISFQFSYGTAMTKATDVTIYMGITSKTEFSSTSDWVALSDLTEVYSGALNCSQGWNEFTLTTPFNYDGSGNLVLAVHDNTEAYDGSSYTFYYTSGTANKTLYYQNDNTACPANAPVAGTLSAYRNNIQFCFEPKACPDVKKLKVDQESLSTTEATVSWEPMGSETAWNVFISENPVTDFSDLSGFTVENMTVLSKHFTGLEQGTDYYVYVQPDGCAGADFSEVHFQTIATCKKVMNLEAVAEYIKHDRATVTWDDNDHPVGTVYTVAYAKTDEFDLTDPAIPTVNSDVNTTSALLSGLEANTEYTFAVKADCGSGDESSWSETASFKTAYAVPFSEAFGIGSSIPADWNRYTGLLSDVLGGAALTATTSGWGFGAKNDIFANHAFVNIYGTSCKYWLVTPNIYLSQDNIQLTFDLALTLYSTTSTATPTDDDRFVVLISTDNGATWTILREWNNTGSEYVYDEISTTGKLATIDLSSYYNANPLNVAKIAFYGESTTSGGDYNLHIDNVSIDVIPDCAAPTGLAIVENSITTDGASFTWDNIEGGAWKYACALASGAEPADEAFADVAENTVPVSGLTDNSDYIFYLRQVCGGAMSESVTKPFHTKQAPESVPYSTDFESGNDWMFINGTLTNAWAYGEAAHDAEEHNHALYISNDNGANNAYTNNAEVVVYAVKLFHFEAGKYSFSYDWKANGESSYDYLRVALVPASVTLTAGTSLPSGVSTTGLPTGWIALDGSSKNGKTDWQSFSSADIDIEEGDYNVVLLWRDDTSTGTNPPAAVDNFSIVKVTCSKPTNVQVPSATILYNAATVSWTAGGEESAWNLQYKASDAADWTLVENVTNPYTITSLTTGTTYQVQVQAACEGEGNVSQWTNAVSFTPTCKTPTLVASGISNIGTTSADIAWTANGGEDTWNIQYKLSTDEEWTTISAITENPYTLDNLSAGKTYQVKVASASCEGTYTSAVSFNTECEALTIDADHSWSENFDDMTISSTSSPSKNVLPNCWSYINNSTYESYGTTYKYYPTAYYYSSYPEYANTPNNSLRFYSYAYSASYDPQDQYAILPEMNGINNARIKFNARAYSTGSSYDATFKVGVMTNPADVSTFTQVGEDLAPASTSYEPFVVKFNSYDGEGKYIAIMMPGADPSSTYYHGLFIDDIVVEAIPDCLEPSDVVVSDIIQMTSAQIAWTAGEGQTAWQIAYKTSEDADFAIADADANPFAISTLTAATAYSVKVRAVCGGDYSEWSDVVSFATEICNSEDKKAIRYELTDQYTDGWNGAYLKVVHKATNIEIASLAVPGGQSIKTINGTLDLCCGEEYSFVWASGSYDNECSFVIYDVQDEVILSHTQGATISEGVLEDYTMACPSCLKPKALNVPLATIVSNAAEIHWTNGEEGQTAWQIAYKTSEDADFAIADADANPFTLTGLTAQTEYTVKVRANCGEGEENKSEWTETVNFTTAAACQIPDGVAASEISANSATITWNAYGQSDFNLRYSTDGTNWTEKQNVNTPYIINGELTQLTAYQVQVQAICNTDEWSPVADFTTKQQIVNVPYATDFESGNDWKFINGDLSNAWAYGEAVNNGGTHALYISNDGGVTNAYTPGTSSATNPVVVYAAKLFHFEDGKYSFSYDWKANGESSYDYLRVALVPASVELAAATSLPSGVSTTGLPSGWIALDGGSKLNEQTTWQTYNSAEMNIEGDYNVVLLWRNDGYGGTNPPAAVDNFNIEKVTCSKPTGVTASNVIYNAADISWTAGGEEDEWNLRYKASDATDWTEVNGLTDATYSFENLISGKTYQVQVQAVCDEASQWTTAISFIPQCLAPTFGADAVTNITTTGADIAWTAGNGESEWTLKYKKSSETVWAEESVTGTPAFTLSGLTSGTTYQVKVASVCGKESAIKDFNTECETITSFPYSENFDGMSLTSAYTLSENKLPACWNYINTSTYSLYKYYPTAYYYSYTNYANSTPNTLKFYSYYSSWSDYDPQDQYAVLPEMEGISGLRMRFNARAESSTANSGSFIVGVMTDPADASTFVPVEAKAPAGTTYEAMEVRFNAYTGEGKYIAIKMEAASSSLSTRGFYIDDIVIDEIPDCEEASGLAVVANSISANGASFTWDNYETGAWKYAYALASEDEPAVENFTAITTNSVAVSGLTDNADYIFYLRNDCGSSVSPSISVPFQTKQLAVEVGNGWSDNFENGKHWKFVNGTCTNAWALGEAAHNGEGTHAMYISNDEGTSNAYSTTSSTMVYAAKKFTFADGLYIFSYDWMANGESSYDYLRVALVPASVELAAATVVPSGFSATALPNGWIALDGGSKLNQASGWQTVTTAEMNVTAGDYMVVFAWRNDDSQGTNPPAAIDNFSITKMTCLKPTGLTASAASGSSINLSWTQGNEETAWNAQYRIGSGAWTIVALNDAVIDGTSCSAMLNGLEPQTTYEIQVQANCGDVQSSWSASATETTLCAAAELPFSEDFNSLTSGIPACWDNAEGTTTTANQKWTYYATGHDGKCVRFNSYNNASGNDNYLKTPAITITDDDAVLYFWYKNPLGGDFSVLYSLDGVLQEDPLASGLTDAADWTEMSISLAACAGHDVVIIFKGTSNHNTTDNVNTFIYLDDVRIARELVLMDRYEEEGKSNAEILAAYMGKTVDVTIGRKFTCTGYDEQEDHYNVICLPFSLSAEQLAASPIASDDLWAFKYAKVDEATDELLFRIIKVESIEAGKPYFIGLPASEEGDIVNPKFKNVTISATEGQNVGDESVAQLRGILDKEQFAANDHSKLFIYPQTNTLYWWAGNEDSWLYGFRAFFKVNVESGNNSIGAPVRHGMPARLIKEDGNEVPTSLDETQSGVQTIKLLENDHVVIIRNGVKYSIQGQVISK